MAKTRYGFLVVALLTVMLLGSSAWAASITGTVYNASGKSGRIYLSVQWSGGGDTGIGVSIPAAGSFTINGVQANGGSYVVKAFMDTQATGVQHANDPSGTLGTGNIPSSSSTVSVGTITLGNPSTVNAQAPQLMVFRGSGGNFLIWDGPKTNDDLPIADKYTVSWSTDGGSTVAGSKDSVSGYNDFFAHGGGSSTLYYQVKAVVGGTTASSAWTPVPAASGTGSATGKVYFPGVTTTGHNLYVAMVDFSVQDQPKFSVFAVTSPASGVSYTINNVPAGNYEVVAFLDLNDSGTYDAGDVGWLDNDDFGPKVTVSTAAVTVADITLNNVDSSIVLATDHGKQQWGEWYTLKLIVQSMKKRVVNARIVSGPQLSSSVDAAADGMELEARANVAARPTVGESYQVEVTYSDGTTETVSKSVTAVLDGLPTPLAPVGYSAYNAKPTFSWSAPSPAPAEYVYSLWMNENNGGWMWDAWAIPSSTTSLVYASQGDFNQATLNNNTTYNWNIEAKDRNGNSAQNQVSFTLTSSPTINSFTPAGGLAGTVVTISGVNFNPNPASNSVQFQGVPATVTAATSTTLTVTVPQGAATGKIQVGTVQSATNFIAAAPAAIQGVIQTSAGDAIAGARVEKSDDSTVYTTTAADGSFTLSWFSGQSITLKITKSGYVPTYTTSFNLGGNLDLRPYPSHLYTQTELTSWGVASGKGIIVGQVLNTGTTPYSPVGGVVVTAQGSQNYPVTYYSGTLFGGSSTYSNGFFFVPNVNDNDGVYMNASKSSWSFSPSNFNVRANSVTEGGIFGNANPPSPPSFWNFSPPTGKAGIPVTITGINFSSIMAENIVKFNSVNATVTAASSGSLTVTVPAGATTGLLSVTTAGGTSYSSNNFTMRNTLSVTVTGLGTVTSVPVGISCRTTGDCTEDFDQGTPVNLVATADDGSFLTVWSACAGTGDCSFTMDANRSVTATFTERQDVLIGTHYYALLQNAIDGAANNDTIQAKEHVFTDPDLVFNKTNVQVKFKGGYDNIFSLVNSGYTTLDGKLSVRGGTLRVEKLKIK